MALNEEVARSLCRKFLPSIADRYDLVEFLAGINVVSVKDFLERFVNEDIQEKIPAHWMAL